jgi:outer membrane protein assembly factor BamB
VNLHRILAVVVAVLLATCPAWAEDDVTFHAAPKPLATGAVTHDWPCFLGPTHNAVSSETKLLDALPAGGPKLVWEAKRGTGYAAPAIWKGKLVTLDRMGDNERVDCRETETGKLLWRYEYPSAYQDRYGYCDGPRASPVIQGDRVVTVGAEGKLHCIDLASGKVAWKHDLMAEYKLEQQFFGVGSTPLIDGQNVIVNVGAAPKGPCVVAFDLAGGKVNWSTDEKTTNTWGPSYASPIPAEVNGKHRVFVFAGGESRPPTGGLMCIDPTNGHVDFAIKHRSRVYESVNASSPVVLGNQVLISECYGSGTSLLDVLPDGSAKEVWHNPNFGTHFMTSIVADGFIYGVDGHGPNDNAICCLDLKTGDEKWRQEVDVPETLTRDGEKVRRQIPLARCSLLRVADGRYLCLGEWGHLLWVDLSPKGYKELSRCWLFAAGETWTPPVLSHGLLYVCQNSRDMLNGTGQRLLCYDLRAEK